MPGGQKGLPIARTWSVHADAAALSPLEAPAAVALVVDEEGVTNWIEGWNRASATIDAT